MKLLMISGLTALAVIVGATNMLRSHPSSENRASVAGMPAMREMHKAQQGRLAVEDFEDRSLVFPRGAQP
ncbi:MULTISPECIES: hypothetical protein [Bradyrhizobium]|uniref:Uncharacterized protein n=1 Tax=Bradyrhizobium neotropicale TaxID=1497615 RepID=A0A176ZHJ0_9BRAD|nr:MULTISPECIES: hypothetical protein [Bradyrhizobium]OAF19332.1 hypothetical protein AXW67_36715 [Bradyrhizobium neotropicale]